MSARKRRAVDGGSRTQIASAGREPASSSWSIHPHGTGMLATLHAPQGHNPAARSNGSSSCDAIISAATYIAISDASPAILLDAQPRLLPSSKVLGLRPITCTHVTSKQYPNANQVCFVTACDIKREIIISVLQPSDENAGESLPLLPLLPLSLSNSCSLSCSIADGPSVVL